MERKKIIIIGGHLTPALSVLDRLTNEENLSVTWVGTKYSQTSDKTNSAEYEALKSRGISFISFNSGKLWRKWTLKTALKAFKNLLLIPIGFIHAFYILITIKPNLVFSFGGYLALPLVIVAKLLFIKVVTHEQTLTVGLANRIIGKLADRIYISWAKTENVKMDSKTIISGNPIRTEVLSVTTSNYKFSNNLPLIYITGGNQGANTINWRLRSQIEIILQHANVIHQTGASKITNDFEIAQQIKEKLPDNLKDRYIVRDRIFGPEIGEIFSKASLVVSRSGANTITELLALGKPALLIPIPWSSGNEQQKNADLMKDIGLAKVLKQYDAMPPEELSEAIISALETVLAEVDFKGKILSQTIEKAKQLIKLNATDIIVEDLVSNLL